ncbi:LysR family transcriptional regulator [Radiobacillus kanasensis]|uniref:LysR family transcriptional regulator n=1 Tax=Radiobacillus kanasensis TaxID=2844358 RepID=UPI001E299470|nr:LysR family transcriptional regulator [Radiobacillus kanasensis]UFT99705.1 LysR family transcriptional regulator [Radiobacillus kanasensis]
MELSWLRTFVTAAEKGNFRKTADLLYVSQPTVTVHIKQLEKHLGVALFERNYNRVVLSEEGRSFLQHARRILAVYRETMDDMNALSQGYYAKLRIAISPLIADTILPFVLKQYVTQHPEVEVTVNILDSVEIEEAVQKEEVDIGLTCLPAKKEGLTTELLYEDQVILVTSHDGLDSESAPPIEIEELMDTHYILSHNHPGYWDPLLRELKALFPKLKSMKVSQVHITKRFIVEGIGISFLPSSTVRRELLEGRLIEVYWPEKNLPQANTYVITKYNHSLEKEFMRFLTNYHYT